MFCNLEAAARIEQAEARMMAEIARVAQDAGGAPGCMLEPIEEGVALFLRPGAPVNKAIGFGLRGPIRDAILDAVEERWRKVGATLQIELATVAAIETVQQLVARGYRLVAFENVLGCRPKDVADAMAHRAAHRVERVDPAQRRRWVEHVADAFLAGDGTGAGTADNFARDEIVNTMAETLSVPSMRSYSVHIDGAWAGGGSMRIDPAGVAQLCGSATEPSLRRRGVQSALLAARLAEAASLGCDVAVLTTQPGSQSQQNAQKQGFALLYARAILLKELTLPSTLGS